MLTGAIKPVDDQGNIIEPEIEKILPTAFEKEVVENIATAVKNIA